jgi:CPA2 family monovalent cation:H+ antiporter-2
MSLKEYIADQKEDGAAEQLYCCAVNIGDAPQYVGKTIRESSMKQDWGCFLLGLERNMLPISDPGPDMMLEGGDLVWVLGSQQMGERLVKEGLV